MLKGYNCAGFDDASELFFHRFKGYFLLFMPFYGVVRSKDNKCQ
jgi:hypothetical protein